MLAFSDSIESFFNLKINKNYKISAKNSKFLLQCSPFRRVIAAFKLFFNGENMFGFMQKHRKYLTIVVWISTISFVSAGFVGWGAYSLSSVANAAAVVGDSKISNEKLAREYNRIYRVYNDLLGGNLDAEQAQKMGIEEQALNTLIARQLFLNYAHDLGLRVSDDEVRQNILSTAEFMNNGSFDKSIYERLLQDNQLRARDYEDGVKEQILFQKLGALLDLPLSANERAIFERGFFSEDELKLEVINKADIAVKPSEEGVRKFWEEHKDMYRTERGYALQLVRVGFDSIVSDENELRKYYEDFKNQFLDENGTLLKYNEARERVKVAFAEAGAQKESLKKYIALRNGNSKEAEQITLYESDLRFGREFINALSAAQVGETIKPVEYEGGFVSAKITNIIESVPKEYKDAKDIAERDYIEDERRKILTQKAQTRLADFSGIEVGFVGRDIAANLAQDRMNSNNSEAVRKLRALGLSAEEMSEFAGELFSAKNRRGYILLKNKAVLYEITAQRLKEANIIAANAANITQEAANAKSRAIEQSILEYLQTKYKIIRHNQAVN